MTAPGSTEPTSIGRYELSSTLGVGGFATVYRAHDPALDGDVAVKVLLPQYVGSGDIRGRFLQEARLLRRVESTNLVRVYDIGELDDGRPYFVMELAEGGVLTSRYRGRIDRWSLVRVIDSLAEGLGALHGASVVHRDIKPDNLLVAGTGRADATELGGMLLTEGERLLIGDLGLAKDQDRTSAGPTVAGGTPLYRPPEQMTPGAPISPAADIYAATGVLWFLLTGAHPPETAAVPAQLSALPAAWQAVMERGLAADPTLRHLSVREWAGDAQRALEDSPDSQFQPIRVGDSRSLCPYKGMAAFQPEDAGLFFGRDDLVDTLVAHLQDHSVVVIGGPSGSGKSSLMRAGLIPRLARGAIAGSQQWRVALFNPGSDAVGELLHQIGRLANKAPSVAAGGRATSISGPGGVDPAGPTLTDPHTGPVPAPTGIDLPAGTGEPSVAGGGRPERNGEPPAGGASGAEPVVVPTPADLPHGARRLLDDGPPVVLAIDQFEELFTLNPARSDRELFLDTLAELTHSAHSRIRVVLALRADFYGICAGHPWLNDRINESQLLVGPMSRQELRDAIAMPAQRAGMALEDGLTDLILDDVGAGSGALPLLGHALMETWLRRRGSHLTIEGYRAAGGVSGAISQRAEDVHTRSGDGEQALARRLFLQLVNPGQGTPDTRRRIDRGSLPDDPTMAGLLEKLASARLLTVDDDAVEVAHEALIQSWPRLREWIDADRESLQIRRRIGAAAAEWEAQDRNSDVLYRGTQLAQALEWLADHPNELEPTADEFVTTAREVRDRAERERQAIEARGRRNRRLAFAALAVLAAAALVSSVVAFGFLQRAQDNERVARAQQVQALAAAAAGNAGDQPLLATGLALESMARAEPTTAEARAALVEARVGLDDNRWLPQPFGLPLPVGDALAVAITPDGSTFITGDRQSGEVVFWDRIGRAPVDRVDAHDGGVKDLAVSQDGRWMASLSDKEAKLWDLASDEPEPILLHELTGDADDHLWEVAFSEDGSMVGLATEGSGVLVFDRAGRSLISVSGADLPRSDFLSVAFLDDERVAGGTGEGLLYMVDIPSGAPIGRAVRAGDRGNDIWQLVPDRDRNLLMSLSTDNTVKSWNVEAEGFSPRATLHDEALAHPAGAVLARDGLELIIGAADGRVYRSDPATGELVANGASAALHTDEVRDAALSANGWLVTLGDDQRVQIWRYIGDQAEVDEVITELVDPITDLALSPSAERLASATANGVMVSDAVTGHVLLELGEAVESVTWVGDGRLATGSADGRLQLWDVEQGSMVGENAGHGGTAVRAILAADDGALVASGGDDGRVQVWSGEDLSEVRALTTHGGPVTALDLTPDGGTVVSLGWDQRLTFSPLGGGDGRTVVVPVDGPQALVVHPDGGHVAVGSGDENIRVLDLDGNVLRTMAPHRGGVWDLALTADGQSIAATSRSITGQPGELQLWDWLTGARLGPPFGHDDEAGRRQPDVVVGPDDTVWWSGSDGAIRRLDVLVTEVGCRISEDVIGPRMQERFLSGDDIEAC